MEKEKSEKDHGNHSNPGHGGGIPGSGQGPGDHGKPDDPGRPVKPHRSSAHWVNTSKK